MQSLIRIAVALLCSIVCLPYANVAEHTVTPLEIPFRQIDATSLTELVTATAGDIQPDKIAKYGDNFGVYWQAASNGLSGKVFEALVADTCNRRFRATGEATRLLPTALVLDPHNAADIHCVDGSGTVTRRIQAKLSADGILAALDDPKYASMDLLTCQESLDDLRRRLLKERDKAARQGRPLKAMFQRLTDAIDSGRLWTALPCGAPLPQRTFVHSIGRAHFEQRWKQVAIATTEGVARGGSMAESNATRAATKPALQARAKATGVGPLGDDLTRAAVGSTDDAVTTSMKFARGVARLAGPVASGVELIAASYEAHTTESEYASGRISHRQREVAHAGTVGSVGGSWAGSAGGATGGAMVGTMVCPGAGTAFGAVVGGVGGAVGGSVAGRFVATRGTEAFHHTGNTITAAAEWLGRSTHSAYRWATDW